MNDSIKQFKNFLYNIPEYLKANLEYEYLEKELDIASNLIKKAKRILISWNWSSIPSWMLLYSELLKNWYNISFVKPTLLIEVDFKEWDLIILSSFWWSRWLVKNITEKTLFSDAKLLVLTSKIDKKDIYWINKQLKEKINLVKIFPNEENLFCRPASSVISYIISLKLVSKLLNLDFKKDRIFYIIQKNIKSNNNIDLINFLIKNNLIQKRIIILSSSTLLNVAENISLALKEGCWILSNSFDIEDYWHWNYVPDIKNIQDVFYVVLLSNSINSKKQADRIKSLLSLSKNKITWKSEEDDIYSWIDFLVRTSSFVLNFNKLTNFDMNNPIWVKNNESFHNPKVINFSEINLSFIADKIKKIHKNSSVTIIWISWWSASWKSSLITPKLKDFLSKYFSVNVLNMDNFQMWKEFVEKLKSPYKYDDKRNFCINEVKNILQKIKKWEDVKIPIFSLEKISRDWSKIFKKAEIILLEGIYATDSDLLEELDFSIYVEDNVVNMLTKRVLRYSIEMNLKNGPNWALKQYLKYVLPAQNELVSKQKKTVNTIIITNFDFNYLIKKYNLKEINEEIKDKVLFFLENNNLQVIWTNKEFFIVFSWKIYFKFEINEEILEIFKKYKN